MIILIAGASASGKTTIVNKVANKHGLKVVNIDRLNLPLRQSGLSGKELDHKTLAAAKQHLARLLFLSSALSLEEPYLVEGGWCIPEIANEFRQQYPNSFLPIFCGFPNADPSIRYKSIRGSDHWLALLSKDEAIEWLTAQVRGSKWYQAQCKEYDFAFVDFSNFSTGAANLEAIIDEALAK